MERYFTTIALLGVDEGNLPVHRGMRQKRYESVEKMLDLLDVVKRIGPKFPLQSMLLDPHDPEWDDDMTYLYVDYPQFKQHMMYLSVMGFLFLYNYNMFFHNKNFHFVTKATLGMLFFVSNALYYKYRKQVLRWAGGHVKHIAVFEAFRDFVFVQHHLFLIESLCRPWPPAVDLVAANIESQHRKPQQ